MKNLVYIFLFIPLIGSKLFCQIAQFATSDGLVILTEMEALNNPVKLENVNKNNDIYSFTKNYFRVKSYESYKSFFLNEEYTYISQEMFNNWQKFIQEQKIFVHGYYKFLCDQKCYIAIQYEVHTKDNILARELYLKEVKGKYYHISAIVDQKALKAISIPSKISLSYFKNGDFEKVINVENPELFLKKSFITKSKELIDRSKTVEKVEMILKKYQFSENTMLEAKKEYLAENDNGFITALIKEQPNINKEDLFNSLGTLISISFSSNNQKKINRDEK